MKRSCRSSSARRRASSRSTVRVSGRISTGTMLWSSGERSRARRPARCVVSGSNRCRPRLTPNQTRTSTSTISAEHDRQHADQDLACERVALAQRLRDRDDDHVARILGCDGKRRHAQAASPSVQRFDARLCIGLRQRVRQRQVEVRGRRAVVEAADGVVVRILGVELEQDARLRVQLLVARFAA